MLCHLVWATPWLRRKRLMFEVNIFPECQSNDFQMIMWVQQTGVFCGVVTGSFEYGCVFHAVYHYGKAARRARQPWRPFLMPACYWASMRNYRTWVKDEVHLGFKSLFCNLTRCFDRLLRLKLLWKLLSFTSHSSIILSLTLNRDSSLPARRQEVSGCRFVFFYPFLANEFSIVKMTEPSSWKEAPHYMSELRLGTSCTGTLVKCSLMPWPLANPAIWETKCGRINKKYGARKLQGNRI